MSDWRCDNTHKIKILKFYSLIESFQNHYSRLLISVWEVLRASFTKWSLSLRYDEKFLCHRDSFASFWAFWSKNSFLAYKYFIFLSSFWILSFFIYFSIPAIAFWIIPNVIPLFTKAQIRAEYAGASNERDCLSHHKIILKNHVPCVDSALRQNLF